eukprot:TRINITY_DN5965_c0_g1_i1.p1 TRINITY_DN5965_c0_g1~~TRINITY_DN5965_c0_g1_i1.p1  ORF type:complete len:894 (+),score=109.62 TRINITY_DN5965_c0_g1_i1:70-2751(+)
MVENTEDKNKSSNSSSPDNDKRPGFLQQFSDAVDKGISDFFAYEGSLIGRYPVYTIIFCVILTLLCSIGFVRFEQELDGEDLWTPDDQPSFGDKEYVESLYDEDEVQIKVICISKDDNDANVLKQANVEELMGIWESIQDVVVEDKGIDYDFESKCGRTEPGAPCKVESILDVWDYDRTRLQDSTNILADVNTGDNTDAYGRPLKLNLVMGGLQTQDQGDIISAEVFQIIMYLNQESRDIGGENYDPVIRDFTDDLIDIIVDNEEYQYLTCYISSIAAVDQVSNDAVQSDVQLLTIGYVLIILYTLVVTFRNSPVYCKSQIALFSIIAIGLAIASSFGLASLFGIKFNLVVQTLPFLLLGLGVDDSFVILGAYFKQTTKGNLGVVDRMSETMRHAGTSITVTSLTDLAAFAIGRWTTLPALAAFSGYAALGVLFTFFYQAVFFAAILALEARREDRAKLGAKRFGFGSLPEGKQVQMTAVSLTSNDVEGAVPTPQTDGFEKRQCCGSGEFDVTKPTIITRVIGEYIPSFTLSTIGILIVLALECGLVAWGIVGATNVYMDFQFRDWFVPDGNWLKDAFNVEDKYFSGDSTRFYVYTKEGNYFQNQDQLTRLADALKNDTKYVTSLPPVDSWYASYSSWLAESDITVQKEDEFTRQLENYLDGEGQFYNDDIIIEDGKIISSRILAFSTDIVDGSFAVDALDSYRDVSTNAAPDFSPIPYTEAFLFYDGFRVIASQTVRNLIVAGIAVFIVTLLLLANVFASLLVLLMVVLTDVCLLGFMWYVDLTFNVVTAINIVLAVGLAVDYSAHIAHSYLVVQGTKRERAQLALKDIGGEVFSGGFTTFLGVVIMGAASHYIFQTFFKMFFALIVLGLWHGIILLPVVLSLVGPNPYGAK